MKTKEEYLDGIMSCNCDVAYKSRQLADPGCAFCNHGDDILEIMVYFAQQANGKLVAALEYIEKICLKDFKGLAAMQKDWRTVYNIATEALSESKTEK